MEIVNKLRENMPHAEIGDLIIGTSSDGRKMRYYRAIYDDGNDNFPVAIVDVQSGKRVDGMKDVGFIKIGSRFNVPYVKVIDIIKSDHLRLTIE